MDGTDKQWQWQIENAFIHGHIEQIKSNVQL